MTSNNILCILVDQCLTQPSLKNLLDAADGNKYSDPQPDSMHTKICTLEHVALNGMSPLNTSPRSLGDTMEDDAERVQEKDGLEDTKNRSPSQHDQSSYELTETKAVCTGPTQVSGNALWEYIMASSLVGFWIPL